MVGNKYQRYHICSVFLCVHGEYVCIVCKYIILNVDVHDNYVRHLFIVCAQIKMMSYFIVMQPSLFSSPGNSLFKITSMTAGDFSFNTIFGLESDGMISFPTISYIMWILFIVVMPILFTNMLVSEDIS